MGYISFDSPWLDPSNDFIGATCWKDGDHWTASDEGWTLEDLWELGWKTDSRGVPQFVKAYGCDCHEDEITASGASVREAGMKVSRAVRALYREYEPATVGERE